MDAVNEIHQSMLERIDNKYDKSKGGFFYDATMPPAIEIAKLTARQKEQEREGFIQYCSGEKLDMACYADGVFRHPATYARGEVTLTGEAGAMIRAGELVASDRGLYEIVQDISLGADGTAQVAVVCTVSGIAGNVPAGAIKSFPKTIPRITGVYNPQPITGGYDAESDESLRERAYLKRRTPGTSGNKWHYLAWAKETTGVGDAKVYPLWNGNGTVKVVIINAQKRAADEPLIQAVAKHIDELRPVGAQVTVESAAERVIDISVSITKSDGYTAEQLREAIRESLTNYLASIAFKDNYISYARIGGLLLGCEGVADYAGLTLCGDSENISLGDTEVAVLGGVDIV